MLLKKQCKLLFELYEMLLYLNAIVLYLSSIICSFLLPNLNSTPALFNYDKKGEI